MSWLVVFMSSVVPIIGLFMLLAADGLHGEVRTHPAPLRLDAPAGKRARMGLANKQ